MSIPDPDRGCLGCLYRIQQFFIGIQIILLILLGAICIGGCAYALFSGTPE